MAESTKNIIGGADTGGGVGFGIPADWSGGVQDSLPDPVVDAHNALAEKKLGNLIYMPVRKVMPVLAKEYEALPDESPVRARAVEFEKQFTVAHDGYEKATSQLAQQKDAALELADVANTISGEVRSKQNAWQEEVAGKSTAVDIEDEFDKALGSWRAKVENALRKYDGFKLWHISPKFAAGFAKLVDFDVRDENPFDANRKFDAAIQAFDQAIEELHAVSSDGGGTVLADYQEAEKHYKEYAEGLRRMTEELGRAKSTASKAQTLRLLDDIQAKANGEDDEAGTPSNVPNYRLALETSPRVCGSCRFFKWIEGTDSGECHAFDFTAKAKYTCDAWQAQSLTAAHTAVRDEGQRKMYTKDADDNWVEPIYASPVLNKDGSPKEVQGVVQGSHIGEEEFDDVELQVIERVNYSTPQEPDENAALRAANQEYLPGDAVYSKALRTLALVQGSTKVSGNTVYSLKLIDNHGNAWGSGVSFGRDLQPRSKKATKSRSRRVKSADVGDMVEITRSVYKALKSVVDAHANLMETPLSNKDVLTPLQQDMLKIMEDDMFDNITTGPKRKYFRALQTATYAVGAARQVLFEGYKTINVIRRSSPAEKSQMRNVMVKAQEGAYDKLKSALKQVEDALTLPSATHDEAAPGVKKIFKRGTSQKDLYNGMLDLVAANVTHDNIEIDDDEMPFGTVEYEVSKTSRAEDIDEAQKTLASMISQVRSLSHKGNVQTNIIGSQVRAGQKTNGRGYVASVTFKASVQL